MRGIDNSFGVLSTFLGVHRFFFLLHPHNVFFFSSVFYCSDFNKEHFSMVSRSEWNEEAQIEEGERDRDAGGFEKMRGKDEKIKYT